MRGARLMRSKNMVTLMVCTNATGTHKLPLFFEGKSENPRCFHDHPSVRQFLLLSEECLDVQENIQAMAILVEC